MKYLKALTFFLFISFLLFTGMQCKKDETGIEALPPATQEGKNTFGFLLNGEVWIPKTPLLRQKLDLSYDPIFNNGALSIRAERYFSENKFERLSIGGININKIGTYIFKSDFMNVGYYNSESCNYIENTISTGFITISKLDLTNKIISGTFSFKLVKNGCSIVDATEGRFDIKIE